MRRYELKHYPSAKEYPWVIEDFGEHPEVQVLAAGGKVFKTEAEARQTFERVTKAWDERQSPP